MSSSSVSSGVPKRLDSSPEKPDHADVPRLALRLQPKKRSSNQAIGWLISKPCASTAPVPLFRRHNPDVPVEGGTLAEGTRIRD